MRRVFQTAIILTFVGMLGCQAKLSVSKSFKLPDDLEIVKMFEMPAQPGAQSITVNVTVKSGSNVDVFVVPTSLVGMVIGKSVNEKKTWEEKGYGFKRDMKTGTATAKVPANVEYKVIVIQSDDAKEKSEIDVKITN